MVQHLLYLNSIIVTLQKRKHSTSEAGTMSLSKRRYAEHITTHEKESKLGTPKEERAVLSHSSQSDQKRKATIKARLTRRALEGTIVCSHPFTVNCVTGHLTSIMINLYVQCRGPYIININSIDMLNYALYEGCSESNLSLFQATNVEAGESSRMRGSIT
jgi:hypothetical protein